MKKDITIGIIFLLLFSALSPIVIGLNDDITNEKESQLNMQSDVLFNSIWPVKCHDARHTGRSQFSTEDNIGIEKWRFKTIITFDNSPVIDNNGVLYFHGVYDTRPWYLYAVNPDGTLKWRVDVGGADDQTTPAIGADGTIYIGTNKNNLYAFNPDGTLKWKFHIESADIVTSPVIANDGTIYFGDCGGYKESCKVYAVNPDGTEKWSYTVGAEIYSDPCIGEDGTVYIGSNDNYLYALYPNGTLRWRFKAEKKIKCPPSVGDDGTIYVGSHDKYLYAIYPDGSMRWKYYLGFNIVSNPSIASDGTVYVGGDKLYAIYPNGTLRWSYDMGGNRYTVSSPAISADGTIFIGTEIGSLDGGELIAVNPNGTEKWRNLLTDCWVRSSPCIGEDGTVYIGGSFMGNPAYLFAVKVGILQGDAGGPYYGWINEPIQFNGFGSGGYEPLSYHWNFGDDSTSEEQNPIHIYEDPGNYTVTLVVTDVKGNNIIDNSWSWIQSSNTPPGETKITGPKRGGKGTYYNFTFLAIDDSVIFYYIIWGDGLNSGWIGPYSSGELVTKSHKWSGKGTYTIKAKAKDPYGEEGPWGYLEVNIPRTRASTSYHWLIERFPMLERLLGFNTKSLIFYL